MPKGARVRIAVGLAVALAMVGIWEHARQSKLRPVTGEVVAVERVASGRGGDHLEFTVAYRWQGQARSVPFRGTGT